MLYEGSMGAPDGRKKLPQLRDEWAACTKCRLGERRLAVEGSFVFGTGKPRSIMFVGEGPGIEEERQGLPFVGKSGQLLRTVLQALRLEQYYLTNIVTCRSCEPRLDAKGVPLQRKNFKTKQMELVYQDIPPPPACAQACLPRLYEEIYLVDPVLIVGLGATACETLMKRSVTITREHGETSHIEVPGATHRPALTPGGKWARKVLGVMNLPTEQNQVQYLFIPTLHPAFVLRSIQDEDIRSWFRQFYADVSKAVTTYNAYLEAVLGTPAMTSVQPDGDVVWKTYLDSIQENNDG
jgi:uracil-DNA glycosylase